MEKASRFKTVLNNPFGYAKRLKLENGRRIVGTFLSDVPEELIDAAGLLPFALIDGSKTQTLTTSIPGFACSLVINTMNQALQNRLDFLDGIVIPHLCDSSRALFHILQKNFPDQFSDLLGLPMKLGSQGTKTYLVGEMKRFQKALESAFTVTISNEALLKSIITYNENRHYLRTIKASRLQDPDFMTNYDFFSLVKSSMLMPKKDHNKILINILNKRIESPKRNSHRRPVLKIFVSGKLVAPLEIFKWMDELGIVVSDDDLAVGSRYFSYEIKPEGDPINALAESYFHRIPNTFVQGTEDRLSYLLSRIQENNLRGVIFIQLKSCDPLTYDYPDLKKALDQKGIPNLFIETDLQTLAAGQIKTKLQAFNEILEGNL
jgi:benzoyl-CoA reductase subunit C